MENKSEVVRNYLENMVLSLIIVAMHDNTVYRNISDVVTPKRNSQVLRMF